MQAMLSCAGVYNLSCSSRLLVLVVVELRSRIYDAMCSLSNHMLFFIETIFSLRWCLFQQQYSSSVDALGGQHFLKNEVAHWLNKFVIKKDCEQIQCEKSLA